MTGKGDKNGFKLGGEGIAAPHIVRDCLSFKNGASGFTSNSNPAVKIESAFAFDNAGANFQLTTYAGTRTAFSIGRAYSFKNAGGVRDSFPLSPAAPQAFFFDGRRSRNPEGKELTREAFEEALKATGFSTDILRMD